MSHIDALREAIRLAGGQGRIGQITGRSQQTVSYWISSGGGLPPEHVLTVEAHTGVPRWRLRPDIYPPHLPAGPLASPGAYAAVAAEA